MFEGMGRGEGNPEEKGSDQARKDYNAEHGSARKAHREALGGTAPGDGAAGPPGFPSIESLKAANQWIHDKAGQPGLFKLDQPSPLESALERARASFEPTDEGRARTAALLAYGIARAQAFRDGNRRTAYFAAHYFLTVNGLERLIRSNERMLTRHLNALVENQSRGKPAPGPETFIDLFTRRLRSDRGQ